jgi:hypothetical protein
VPHNAEPGDESRPGCAAGSATATAWSASPVRLSVTDCDELLHAPPIEDRLV